MMYRLLRWLWRVSLHAFFRRIDTQGRDRVPARGATLIVANHTNAFVDPFLILTELDRVVSLTAKSTLRRNPLLAALIRGLHVVELHRTQDVEAGADPRKNRDALAECRRRLAEGGCIVIFPEGVSHSDPALRPFRTGAARIALDYLAEHPGAALTIVPAGLHYEAKERFRSAAGVVYGEPMDAAEWLRRTPDGDARALTDEIERRIRALTRNFASEDEVHLFTQAADIFRAAAEPVAPLGWDVPHDHAQDTGILHALQDGRTWLRETRPDQLDALERRVVRLHDELRRVGVAVDELFLSMHPSRAILFVVRELELLVVGLPMAAWGTLNHLLPFLTLRGLVRRMSTDRDHFASNTVFLAVPLVPVFYALQVAVAAFVLSPGWLLVYALTLPLTGAVALLWRDRSGAACRRARTFVRFLFRPGEQVALRAEVSAIASEMRALAGARAAAAASTPAG